MAGVNKVILIGNLGSDPEVKYLDGGSVVARFNIATTEAYNNRNGERVEQTEWHRIELWDNLAKIAEQYLRKGNPVYIEGKLRTETWQDKDGTQKSSVRIRATGLQLLGGRPGGSNDQDGGYESSAATGGSYAGAPSAGPTAAAPTAAPRQAQPAATATAQPARPAAARKQPDPAAGAPVPFDDGNDQDDLPF